MITDNKHISKYSGSMTHYVVTDEVLNNIFGEPSVGTVEYLSRQHNTKFPCYYGSANLGAIVSDSVANHMMTAVIKALQEKGYTECERK